MHAVDDASQDIGQVVEELRPQAVKEPAVQEAAEQEQDCLPEVNDVQETAQQDSALSPERGLDGAYLMLGMPAHSWPP